jgi:hypothetical protein
MGKVKNRRKNAPFNHIHFFQKPKKLVLSIAGKEGCFDRGVMKIRYSRNAKIMRRNEEQGSVLVFSVLVLTILVLFAAPFLFQLSNEHKLTDKSFKSMAALSLAEAGVERAIWELNHGNILSWSGDDSLRTMAISSFQTSDGIVIGDIDIRIENPLGANPVIEATGRVPYPGSLEVTRTTRVELEIKGFTPFDYAVFGEEEIQTNVDTDTNSYDSRLGEYDVDGNRDSYGNIGTNSINNGGITLNDDSEISGNAYTGLGSDPSQVIVLNDTSEIYKHQLALSNQKELPSIIPPENLPYRGLHFLTDGASGTINQSGKYSSFILLNNATTTIEADITIYVTGEFLMRNNTTLIIDPGAKVRIYLGDSFDISQGSMLMNQTEDPTKLLILGTDSFNGTMYWGSNCDFYGAIYAPRANIEYAAPYKDIFGSLVAKKLISNAHYDIHYDKALSDITLTGRFFAVKSWQERRLSSE